MRQTKLQTAAAQRTSQLYDSFGQDLQRLREDAGASQRALSRETGVSQSEISRIEHGLAEPSIETCVLLGAGVGADVSLRLFPNTGAPIRDRYQAPIVEALFRELDRRWKPWPEVGVRQPVRGWIDAVLADRVTASLVATEVVSAIKRLEQLVRWSNAKADAIGSATQWPFGIEGTPIVSSLLILRSTEANRALMDRFRSTIDAAYPADPWQAIDSLTGEAPWPGSTLLWAVDAGPGRYRLVAAPSRRR